MGREEDGNRRDGGGVTGRGSMRDRVVDELRRAITRGDLAPGERLTEWTVANQLGVSRGPVREGMLELEREGLLRINPNRGAIVMGMTDEELLDLLLPIRLTIERFAATALSQSVPDTTVADLESHLAAMTAAAERGDTDAVMETDLAFHRCMVEASEHAHALQLWQSIYPRIGAQLHRIGRGRTGSLPQIPGEHRALIELLQNGDAERLAEALEQHILGDARRFMPRPLEG